MATVTIANKRAPRFGNVPYGNQSFLPFTLKTNSVGAAIDSNVATGLAVNDKVVLGILPAGFVKDEINTVVTVGLTATLTGDLGIEYVDGEDSSALPQSTTYFGAGIALATVARIADTGTQEPIPLPKDAYLVLTVKTVANAKAGNVSFLVKGEQR